MPEFASLHIGHTIALVESSPLNPDSWEKLAEAARDQNDPLSVKSLEVIVDGLRKFEELQEQAATSKTPAPQLSTLAQAMFVRLAKAYNSPTLLKQVGLIYLRDLRLPEVALAHFERSLLLGAPEKELRPLTDAAAVAVQRDRAQKSGQEPELSGLTSSQHTQPEVTSIICRTGKMLLPTRFTRTAGLKPTVDPAGEKEAAQPMPATTAECLAEAAEVIKKGSFARAEALLRRANEQPSAAAEMWQSWTDLGQACYEAGDFARVETAFVEAIPYGTGEMATYFNAALGYHLNQKFEKAVEAYAQANELQAAHPKVWCNLGVLYFQMEAYAQAEEALRQAVQAHPGYARAWDNLAASMGAQGKLDEAVDACRRAVLLKPDYPEAYFKLGVIYFSRNQLEEAATEFQRAAVLPALGAYCSVFLAMVHARLAKPELADADVRRAARIDPKCDLLWMAWNDVGLSWFSEKNYQRAVEAYSEATMLKPGESAAWFNLGLSYHQVGDLKAARESYQHAVDLHGSQPGAFHNLGIICAESGDLATAVNAFQQETMMVPNNVRAWHDLGVALEKLGRHQEARVAFGRADIFSGQVNHLANEEEAEDEEDFELDPQHAPELPSSPEFG